MTTVERDAAIETGSAQAMASPLRSASWRRALLRLAATLVVVAAAATLGWFAWGTYMGTPWTRDGTVRAYVVTIAPDVAGQIVELPLRDNQFVHKGDLLLQIDPSSYAIAVQQAEAQVAQAKAVAENAAAESQRRQELNNLAVTVEEQQTYASQSANATAAYQLQLANLANARLNLKRARIVSPVNGYVTNLQARAGDYANVGARQVSVIDADSFWVDGYFEETFLGAIHDGDAAEVKLMGYPQVLRGHVQSLARGISVANAAPSSSGLATVNPVFTFVRLAQRVPVRVKLDAVPDTVRLVAGTTATVEIVGGGSGDAASHVPPAPTQTSAAGHQPPSSAPSPPPSPAPLAPAPTAAGAPPAAQSTAPAAIVQPPASSNTTEAEASEVRGDEAPANVDRPVPRAPNSLRRRGRWRHHERQ